MNSNHRSASYAVKITFPNFVSFFSLFPHKFLVLDRILFKPQYLFFIEAATGAKKKKRLLRWTIFYRRLIMLLLIAETNWLRVYMTI